MTSLRKPGAALLLSGIFSVSLIACDNGAESTASGVESGEPETELEQVSRTLRKTRETLAGAEQRNRTSSEELERQRRQLAEAASSIAELRRHLDQTRTERDRGRSFQTEYRRQLAQAAGRSRELMRERDGLRAALAKTQDEIRHIRARQGARDRALADLRYRLAIAAREGRQLKSYNASLLQELANLQTWLQQANASQRTHRDKLHRVEREAEQARASHRSSRTEAARLQAALNKANYRATRMKSAKDYLVDVNEANDTELASVRASNRERAEELRSATTRIDALKSERDSAVSALAALQSDLARSRETQTAAESDVAGLREQLASTQSRVTVCQQLTHQLEQQLDTAGETLAASTDTQVALGNRLLAMRERMSALSDEKHRLEGEIHRLRARLESVESDAGSIKE